MDELASFAEVERLCTTALSAVGAFESATLGYFDGGRRGQVEIGVEEQAEVLTMAGDIVGTGNQRKIHAHVVLGCRDGSTRRGYLLGAVVRPALEIMLSESPGVLFHRDDQASGLSLLDLS